MGRIQPNKYCTKVLKGPISLKFYRNFTSVSRQRNHHQQKSGYELLLRRGILPERFLEPEAEVAEYVQSRVQNLALEISSRFQITEREAEQKIRENL